MKTLYLFTGSYPYSAAAETTFLPQELRVLSQHFGRIVLVPGTVEGTRDEIPASNISVDTGFAEFARKRKTKWLSLVRSPVDPEFLSEFAGNLGLFARSRFALRRALGHYVQAQVAESWIRTLYEKGALDQDAVLYTWWFDAPTLGLARFGKSTGLPVITRAHGYDVYEARHSPPYIPFRQKALELVDRVYPDSDAGARYLADRYPNAAARISAALLGVEDPGFETAPSSDGVFRIVSCSFLSPVKRIDRLIKGLAKLGADYPQLCVEWTHIGDGPEKDRLAALASASLPPNVRWHMGGYPGKEGLYEYYRTNPVDLFVNVSESEGTPVSLMEALSVGIPVLCTAVGGNIEVVGNGNGMLIAANPSPEELSKGLWASIGSPEESTKKRAASRSRWEQRYNAGTNYAVFAASVIGTGSEGAWKKSRVGM